MTAVSATLPRSADSLAAARRLVDRNGENLTATQRADVGLMASELVANALCHGHGEVTIRIVAGADAFTVEVSDQGDGSVAIAPTPGAAGGWGLRIVDQLADGWGVRSGSTCVWFRVLLDRR